VRIPSAKSRPPIAGVIVVGVAFVGSFYPAAWAVGIVVGGVYLLWPGIRRFVRRMAAPDQT